MLHLILGTDWTANRDEILRRVSNDVRSGQEGRILMVPELISHDTERRLCEQAGPTASRFAEVLSFTRLARRVSDSVGSAAPACLDNGGRLVAMAAAARGLAGTLKVYGALETRPEFLTGMIDAVDEFKRCCIRSDTLMKAAEMTEGSFSEKLKELALLMEAYDAFCERGKKDPRDQMTWCLEQLEECDYARNHVFYIDGFPDFTRQHLEILGHLIRESSSVTVSLNCDGIGTKKLAFEKAGDTARQILAIAKQAGVKVDVFTTNPRSGGVSKVLEKLFQDPITKGEAGDCLSVFQAETPYQEAVGAAEEVLKLIRGGCRYRDINLVCSDVNVYGPLVRQVFNRYGIPLYQSGTEDILQKSVVSTVLNALDAALSGFEQRAMLRYLRSALSPLDMDRCDLLENYTIIWGIRGKKWTEAWVGHPQGLSGRKSEYFDQLLSRINEAREEVIKPLDAFASRFSAAVNLGEQVLALYAFLEDIQLKERLNTLAEELDAKGQFREAQILGQLWDILIGALEQMHDTLGRTAWEKEHFVDLLRMLLSQYDVGTIPPVLDAVQVGPVSAQRLHQQKHLLVLGAQEGNLPGYSGSAGVLTDQEREYLRKLDVQITGGAMDGIRAEFAEIYGVFCGAMESVRVWCSSEQPSFVFRRLKDLAGGVQDGEESLGVAPADALDAAAYLARWNASESAKELEVGEAYSEALRRRDYDMGEVSRENIRALYGKSLNLSASRIETQAKCPMSYFLEYGLQAKERREATVDPAEFGTYVHYVLENTCREIRNLGGFALVTLEETRRIAHEFSEKYQKEHFSGLSSERMTYLFQRNLQELDVIVAELWEELKDSAFEPADFEIHFGSGKQAGEGLTLPAISIPNKAMRASLTGFIDRMDTWEHNGNTYYRIVDYKTGPKEFDYCDVFEGIGLQMLLYLYALRGSGHPMLGDRPIPVGVQYFPARAKYLSIDGSQDEDAQKKRDAEWHREGLLLDDAEILNAMEPGGEFKRLNLKVSKKDGAITGDLASREEFKLLEQFIFRKLAQTVESIASGNVAANPYIRGDRGACTYCPYGPICHKNDVEKRERKKMDAKTFWRDVEEVLNRG